MGVGKRSSSELLSDEMQEGCFPGLTAAGEVESVPNELRNSAGYSGEVGSEIEGRVAGEEVTDEF